MMKFYHIVFLCVAVGMPTSAQSLNFVNDPFACMQGDTVAEKIIAELVNAERAKAKLSAIQYDRQLSSAARQHALEMYQLNYFSHTSPVKGLENPGDRVYQTGLTDFAVGENIALHSIQGNSKELAEKFMEQWMNSEGHRANILKEDFNRMGVGVLSRKDSVVHDTVIHGNRVHQVTYAIRNYGAQVFSDRDLEFYELCVETRAMPFVDMELLFNIDRPVLARIGTLIGVFDPDKYHTTVRYSGIYDKPLSVQLAYLDNYQHPVYINFFSGTLDQNRAGEFEKALSRARIKMIRKQIKFIYETRPVLRLKSRAIMRNLYRYGVVYFDPKKYYEFEPRRDTIEALIPLDAGKKDFTVQFGLGEDQGIQMKHHVIINADMLTRLKKKKTKILPTALFNKTEVTIK